MWIDSHAHLYGLTPDDLAAQLSECTAAGVGIVVATATDCETALIVTGQCDVHYAVWGAVGISPFDAADLPETWYATLNGLLAHPKVIAVGEIGIDATNPRYPPLSLQQPIFEKQLACARDLNLPAVIHSRGAEERAVDICKDIGVRGALFHCFTGSRTALAAILDEGYYVSLSGIVTFRNSNLRDVVRAIAPERLLIETDTPYLAPVPHRGEQNRPAWVRFVGEEVARLLGMEDGALQEQLEGNFRRLFGKFVP